MSFRICLTAAITLVLLGIGAGCGGGDDETASAPAVATTPAQTTLTKEELLSQGDAICAEVNAAVGTVSSTDTDPAARVAQEADLYGGMVERLKALGTSDDASGYAEFISAAEGLAQAEGNAGLAAARGDDVALQSAESEASTAGSSFRSAAQSYGFEECGEEPSAPATSGTAPSSESESSEAAEGESEAEAAPEAEAEPTPETGGAGSTEAGGGAAAGGGSGGSGGSDGSSSGGIGPG